MAHGAEDCASVLEQFVHDVANLPAEINHLMEEIQAKDKLIQESHAIISSRDSSLQKFIKANGSLTLNPKEEQYGKTILQNMDKCRVLQEEKIQLSEKACILLDRQVKKLDIKIRDLINDGVLSNDPPLPSLFNNKDQYRDPPRIFFPESTTSSSASATASTSYSTPPNSKSGNTNGMLGIAQRAGHPVARSGVTSSLVTQNQARNSAPATPAAATAHLQQRHRELSVGAVEAKRRRLNGPLSTLPAASSNLRQLSLGPGTPRAGTPTPGRSGSAGPRTSSMARRPSAKKVAPHQQVKKVKTSALTHGKTKRSSSSSRLAKGSGAPKKSPSAADGDEDEDDSMLSSVDGSDSDNASESRHADGDADENEDDEGNEDSKVYCTCRSVSHGDMVACDNDNCPYEWFHWKCVGLTREPVGTWYCDECRKTLER